MSVMSLDEFMQAPAPSQPKVMPLDEFMQGGAQPQEDYSSEMPPAETTGPMVAGPMQQWQQSIDQTVQSNLDEQAASRQRRMQQDVQQQQMERYVGGIPTFPQEPMLQNDTTAIYDARKQYLAHQQPPTDQLNPAWQQHYQQQIAQQSGTTPNLGVDTDTAVKNMAMRAPAKAYEFTKFLGKLADRGVAAMFDSTPTNDPGEIGQAADQWASSMIQKYSAPAATTGAKVAEFVGGAVPYAAAQAIGGPPLAMAYAFGDIGQQGYEIARQALIEQGVNPDAAENRAMMTGALKGLWGAATMAIPGGKGLTGMAKAGATGLAMEAGSQAIGHATYGEPIDFANILKRGAMIGVAHAIAHPIETAKAGLEAGKAGYRAARRPFLEPWPPTKPISNVGPTSTPPPDFHESSLGLGGPNPAKADRESSLGLGEPNTQKVDTSQVQFQGVLHRQVEEHPLDRFIDQPVSGIRPGEVGEHPPEQNPEYLDRLTFKELQVIAKERGISAKRIGLSKAKLIDAILQGDQSGAIPEPVSAAEVPLPAPAGENLPSDSAGVRPGQQGLTPAPEAPPQGSHHQESQQAATGPLEATQSDLQAPIETKPAPEAKTQEKAVSEPVQQDLTALPIKDLRQIMRDAGYQGRLPMTRPKLIDMINQQRGQPPEPPKPKNKIPLTRQGMVRLPFSGEPPLRDKNGNPIPETDYGYWIGPDGTYHMVPKEKHEKAASDLTGDKSTSPYITAFDQGYIRVVSRPGEDISLHLGTDASLANISSAAPLVEDTISRGNGVNIEMPPDMKDVWIDDLKTWKHFVFSKGRAKGNDPNRQFGGSRHGAIALPSLSPKTAETLRQNYEGAKDSLKRASGETFPAHSRINAPAAEAAAKYISSQEVSNAESALGIRHVLGDKPVGSDFDRNLGDVILEDGLRGDKLKFQDEAAKLRADAATRKAGSQVQKNLLKQADKAEENANNVRSIIGDPNHTLPDEAAYTALKADTEIKSGLNRHIKEVMPKLEEMYRLEAGIAASTPVPVRGRDTGTYLTRKAVMRDAQEQQYGPQGKAGTRKKSSGLTRTAYGTAEQYANTYSENLAHNFARQVKPAAQAEFFKHLIDKGDAIYVDSPNSTVNDSRTREPWNVFENKIQTNVYSNDGMVTFVKPKNQYIAVRPELAKEFERITNVTNKIQSGGIVSAFSNINTSLAMMSTAEPTAHLLNHVAQLYKILVFPGRHQGIASNIGFGEANLANVPLVGKTLSIAERMIPKLVKMAMGSKEILEQTAELAKVAGLQPEKQTNLSPIGRMFGAGESPLLRKIDPFAWVSKGIGAFTKASRLVGLDAYKAMADAGVIKDTALEKSRFINQFTQYHHEAQLASISLARKLGLGPFASASQNFFMQRFKGLLGSTNVKGADAFQSARLRAGTLLSAWGSLAGIGLINYVLWGKMKPSGTPVGSIVYGKDKQGRYKYLNAAKWMGLIPAGVGEAATVGLEPGGKVSEAIDKGMRGFASSLAAPYIGPAVQSAYIGVTGKSPISEYQQAKQVPEGQSQAKENWKAAAQHLNPAVAALTEDSNADTGGSMKLLGAFAPKTGRAPATSAADYVANEILSRKPKDIVTQEQRQRFESQRNAVEAIRAGQKPDWTGIPNQRRGDVYKSANTKPLADKVRHMNHDEAMEVWREEMPAEDRKAMQPIMLEKLSNPRTIIDESKRRAYLKEVTNRAGK